jgi:hypothetical protein
MLAIHWTLDGKAFIHCAGRPREYIYDLKWPLHRNGH